jgi:prepilin signal peptidase PulO-like enzyme (type II secretory pathway)
MSVDTIPMPEPSVEPEAAPQEQAKAERRPLAELVPTGTPLLLVAATAFVLFVASFIVFGLHGRAFLGAVLCPALVLLAAIDAKHKLLPNAIIYPVTPVVALIVAASTPGSFLSHLAAAAALGGFFFVFGLIFAGSFGMGDAKLGFLLGLALGSKTFAAALLAFAGLLVAALYVLATRGVSARKDAIPFGPFLAVGGIVAFFLG